MNNETHTNPNQWADAHPYGLMAWHKCLAYQKLNLFEVFPNGKQLLFFGTQHFKNKSVLFGCNSKAVLHIIHAQTSKSLKAMHLVCHFVLHCLQYTILSLPDMSLPHLLLVSAHCSPQLLILLF